FKDKEDNLVLQILYILNSVLEIDSSLSAHVIIGSIMFVCAEIMSICNSIYISHNFNVPLLTRDFSANMGSDFIVDKYHESFALCQIAMQEEMGYMPVVESFDDLLRLRENKSIDEFRNKLYEWYEELPKGKFDTLKKIKSDIKKTNQELKRLEKWRRLDRI